MASGLSMSRTIAYFGEEGVSVVSNWQSILKRIEFVTRKAENGVYFRGKKPALVAVSKTISTDLIEDCYRAGQLAFGENYINELKVKAMELTNKCPNIRWHYIGNLQSNKIGTLVEVKNLHCIETLSSKKHCDLLEREMIKRKESVQQGINVLLQVNTSNEPQKGGANPNEAIDLARYIREHCPSLNFGGFMTIGSFTESLSDGLNDEFLELFKIRQRFCERIADSESNYDLSMGMSHDFETAIMQGSTSVRVGTAIFGQRVKK